MTTHPTPQAAIAAVMLLAASATAAATAAQVPTPEIHQIEETTSNGTTVYIMRAPLGNTNIQVGLAITCNDRPEATVFLGGFPPAHIPVQLAIRTAAGRGERFGPVVHHSGPRSGFHSPQLTNAREITRFLDAALENGALVSNGYNSFWNRVAPERNREVRALMRACGA